MVKRCLNPIFQYITLNHHYKHYWNIGILEYKHYKHIIYIFQYSNKHYNYKHLYYIGILEYKHIIHYKHYKPIESPRLMLQNPNRSSISSQSHARYGWLGRESPACGPATWCRTGWGTPAEKLVKIKEKWLEIQWENGDFFHGTHSPSSPSKNGWISMNFNEIHGRKWWLLMKFHHWHLWFKWIERDLPGWSWGYSQACYGKSMWNSEGMTTRPSDFWLHKLLWDGPLICT